MAEATPPGRNSIALAIKMRASLSTEAPLPLFQREAQKEFGRLVNCREISAASMLGGSPAVAYQNSIRCLKYPITNSSHVSRNIWNESDDRDIGT